MGLAFWRVYHENAQQAVAEGKAEELPASPLQALEGAKSEQAKKAKEVPGLSAGAVVEALKTEQQEVLDRVRQRSQSSGAKSE